jgi:NAD(P)-dependent dehydrogenase (short-subunit alcohol dehydrogenase family)
MRMRRMVLAWLALLLFAPHAVTAQHRQVVLVTGSTDGLGREVALRTAATGAHVLVHGRNRARGDSVVAAITATGTGSAQFYAADFASFDDVRRLAAEIRRDHPRLDILVNNAGILVPGSERLVGAAGHELTFTVNYLSPFLLTRLLLPALTHDGPARIINVASRGQAPLDFDDVMLERSYTGSRAYSQSKLAQITMTMDLATALAGTRITVTALHPATMMATTLVRQMGVEPRSTIDEGASAVMQLVTMRTLENGTYFNGLVPARALDQAYDSAAQQRLRALSERLTGLPPLAR